jgi:hypothetical protein
MNEPLWSANFIFGVVTIILFVCLFGDLFSLWFYFYIIMNNSVYDDYLQWFTITVDSGL